MMEFYIAVLNQNCEAHYFMHMDSAMNYLIDNVNIPNCKIEVMSTNQGVGELWDEEGVSVGYFYKVKTED